MSVLVDMRMERLAKIADLNDHVMLAVSGMTDATDREDFVRIAAHLYHVANTFVDTVNLTDSEWMKVDALITEYELKQEEAVRHVRNL